VPSNDLADAWLPEWGTRTLIMGVINVTPDSFTGDGILGDRAALIQRGRQLASEGADLVDVGGESTRPSYVPVPLEEELTRALPAIRLLAEHCPLPLSIDTTKAEVARLALDAGASVVNDVSGLRDESMLEVVVASGCSLVLVHNTSAVGERDVISFVLHGLADLVSRATQAGVERHSLIIDPGLGFGKSWRQNLEIIDRLSELRPLNVPILVGPSRKATISRVLGVGVHDRLEGTAALVAVGIAHGADAVRVHDCLQMSRVARMMDAVVRPV
jgi:dihydropteroate synthase